MKTTKFVIHSNRVRDAINNLVKTTGTKCQADKITNQYYNEGSAYLWISKQGVKSEADTLLTYLKKVSEFGFSSEKFYVSTIENDLRRYRTLNFDNRDNQLNLVIARLEYYLTKAYLRYVSGQRYGYTNPYTLFNRLDIKEKDSLGVSYHKLFDVAIERPNANFWKTSLEKIGNGGVSVFLKDIQPVSKLYLTLLRKLQQTENRTQKIKLLCNLERARWRENDSPEKHKKYVMVNIPSQHLIAFNDSSTLSMRIGIGSLQTKTPLMNSRIYRMDINPQWVIPKSIISKSIANHAGNEEYFSSRRYFIKERKSGTRMDIASVTKDMLLSGNYFVIQEGGDGNSLGRIIFRFKNNLSIYLHDTPTKSTFSQSNRDVSHGCIRLEKPFDFAVFLLNKQDPLIVERIRFSMTTNIDINGKPIENELDISKQDLTKDIETVKSVSINPTIPLFISYYTLYPDNNNILQEYRDIYKFDPILYQELKTYI